MAKAEGRDQDVPGCVVSTDGGRAWYQKGALSKVSMQMGRREEGDRGAAINPLQGGREG